jgi:hypothetical protein
VDSFPHLSCTAPVFGCVCSLTRFLHLSSLHRLLLFLDPSSTFLPSSLLLLLLPLIIFTPYQPSILFLSFVPIHLLTSCLAYLRVLRWLLNAPHSRCVISNSGDHLNPSYRAITASDPFKPSISPPGLFHPNSSLCPPLPFAFLSSCLFGNYFAYTLLPDREYYHHGISNL